MRNLFHNIVLMCLFLAMSGCAKFEDGPKFSLRTRKARITNTWKYKEVVDMVTGVSQYSGFEGWKMSFGNDDSYCRTIVYLNSENFYQETRNCGTWEFTSKEEVFITEEGFPDRNYTIIRLTGKELCLQDEIEKIFLVPND